MKLYTQLYGQICDQLVADDEDNDKIFRKFSKILVIEITRILQHENN